MRVLVFATFLLVTGVACGTEKESALIPTETDTETGAPPTDPACDTLAADACAARADCAPITGRPLIPSGCGYCVDYGVEGETLGCQPAETSCGEAETMGQEPGSKDCTWLFPTTCLPAGWTDCAWFDVGAC